MIEGGDASLGVANDEQNLHWAACRPWEAARGGTGAADRGGYDMTPEAPKAVKFWGLVRLSGAGRDR